MYRALLAAALLLPACTDHYGSPTMTVSEYAASSWQWLDSYPNRVDLAWNEAQYNCVGSDHTLCDGGATHPIRVTSVTCDGCTLQASPVSTAFADSITMYAIPTIVGTVKITAEVETSDGASDTATVQLGADRVVSLSADCEVFAADYSLLGACSQLAHRPADSIVDISSLATTSHGDSVIVSAYVPANDAVADYLPKLGPDRVAQPAPGDFEVSGPTAASETLSWDGFVDPIAIHIPPLQ